MTKLKADIPNFGFDSKESSHQFAVNVSEQETVVEERFAFGDDDPQRDRQVLAVIEPNRWQRVAEAVQQHFNRRLKDARRKTAKFGLGEHILAAHLGKELAILAWATEGIDPTDMPNAIANWLGLAPEERWWLYGMVKASSTEPEPCRNPRGWRRAIRIAFSESPAPPPASGRHAEPETELASTPHKDDEKPRRKTRKTVSRSLFEGEDLP